jgi:hypothetical protein
LEEDGVFEWFVRMLFKIPDFGEAQKAPNPDVILGKLCQTASRGAQQPRRV